MRSQREQPKQWWTPRCCSPDRGWRGLLRLSQSLPSADRSAPVQQAASRFPPPCPAAGLGQLRSRRWWTPLQTPSLPTAPGSAEACGAPPLHLQMLQPRGPLPAPNTSSNSPTLDPLTPSTKDTHLCNDCEKAEAIKMTKNRDC